MAKKKRRTGKVGAAGRFGPRYGAKLRKRVAAIEREQKKHHRCPQCGADKVRRLGSGIWKCKRCETKFVAKAYIPSI